jgi:membrane-associated PAP2 superfamily phosphatase
MLLLELTSLDMDLAKRFYNAADGGFIGRYSFFLEDILHDRAKQWSSCFRCWPSRFIGTFILQRLKPYAGSWAAWCCPWAWRLRLPVETITAVQCPWSLKEFGGTKPTANCSARAHHR